jgi:PAS domain S-box-containing protein
MNIGASRLEHPGAAGASPAPGRRIRRAVAGASRIPLQAAALAGVLSLTTGIIVACWNDQAVRDRLVRAELDAAESVAATVASRLSTQLDAARRLAQLLAYSRPLPRSHPSDGEGAYTAGGTMVGPWRRSAAGALEALLRTNPDVLRAWYLGGHGDGRWTLGVERGAGSDVITRVPDAELWAGADEIAVTRARTIARGSVEFSPRTLDGEQARVERVRDLVVRIRVPVVATDVQPTGMLELTLDLQNAFQRIAGTIVEGRDLYIISGSGDVLVPRGLDRGVRLDPERPFALDELWPGATARINSFPHTSGRLVIESNERRGALGFARLVLDDGTNVPDLHALVVTDFRDVESTLGSGTSTGVVVLVLMMLAATIAGIVASRLLAKPLGRLTRVMASFAHDEVELPINPDAGAATGAVTSAFLELRERVRERSKALKANSTYLRAMLDNMVEGVLVIDCQGRVEDLNRGAEVMFGHDASAVIGNNVSMLMPQPHRDQHDEYLAHYLQTGEKRVIGTTRDLEGQRSDGTVFPVSLSVAEASLDGARRFIGVVRDASRRKRAEDAVRHSLAASEAASVAKSQFLANISHELRTPLNAIIGYAELLIDDVVGRSDQRAADDLERIRTAGTHLLALLNDVLALSKLEAGEMGIEPSRVEVIPMLRTAADAAHALMTRNGNRFEIAFAEDLGWVETDPGKLAAVLANLLDNAAKFTSQGVVRLEACRQFSATGDEHLVLRVEDSGIGMAEEDLGRIFEPFSQLDATATRRYEGAGLGLAIARGYCALLGARMDVTSAPGAGTEFTVQLPVRVPSAPGAQRTAAVSTTGPPTDRSEP